MTTLHSLKDLGKAFNIKPKAKESKDKEIKCRKCGAPMQVISGTNVMRCTGMIPSTDKDGKETEKPCGNYFFLHQAKN